MPFDATIMASTTNQWQALDPTPVITASLAGLLGSLLVIAIGRKLLGRRSKTFLGA